MTGHDDGARRRRAWLRAGHVAAAVAAVLLAAAGGGSPAGASPAPGKAAAASGYLYWTNLYVQGRKFSGTIGRARLDGTDVTQKFITVRARIVTGIGVFGTYLYWSDNDPPFRYNSPGTIGRARLDGTDVTQNFIKTAQPNGPDAVVVGGGHLYWANDFNIGRARLNGTGVDQNFIAVPNGPSGVAGLAVNSRYIYWTNEVGNEIGRANLNGTGVNQRFITGASFPDAIAASSRYLYWTNENSGAIGRACSTAPVSPSGSSPAPPCPSAWPWTPWQSPPRRGTPLLGRYHHCSDERPRQRPHLLVLTADALSRTRPRGSHPCRIRAPAPPRRPPARRGLAGSPARRRPAAASRALMVTVWPAAGPEARLDMGTDARYDRHGGRGGGQPAAPHEQHGQPGKHIGQCHHHQGRGPRLLAGDVVRGAEPADRRAEAVVGGEDERHPGAHPRDRQAGRHPARVPQHQAVPVPAQVRKQPGQAAHHRTGRHTSQLEQQVVAPAGTERRKNTAAAPTASTGTARPRRSIRCSRIWRTTSRTRIALTM